MGKSDSSPAAGAEEEGGTIDGATPADESAEHTDADESAEVFQNRAARRAQGKSGKQTRVPVRAKDPGSHGPGHSPRLWANRRSG